MKHALLWLAILLLVIWIIVRVALAVTSAFLHLLWIAAVVLFLIWLFRRIV